MNIDIKHIAKLARLRIEDDQLDKFESWKTSWEWLKSSPTFRTK